MISDMAGWESRQIEYVLALSQAPIGSGVYLHLPEVFHVDGEDKNKIYFLKLKKNLNGNCQAAANWFDMLNTGLGYEGVKQKKLDPCLFVKKQLYFDLLR